MNQSLSLAVIEHDIHGDVLVVWTYPGMSSAMQNLCTKRAAVEGTSAPFIYLKAKNDWIYMLTTTVPDTTSTVVNASTFCIASTSFNPEKFNTLLQLMIKRYLENLDPTKALEAYLSIHTTGNYQNFQEASFPDSSVAAEGSVLKELSDILGPEVVILWNAMLLKKRVIIFSDQVTKLLPAVRTLPQLCWHRKDFTILRPLVRNDPESLDDLKTSGVYVAGTVDGSLASRPELYDVFVNLNDHRVTVASHATEEMRMNAAHRELAALIEESAINGSSADVIEAVATKTSEILSQLRSLGDDSGLSEEILREKITSESSTQWLIRLAYAENLI